MRGADLSNADLSGANLKGANVTEERLAKCKSLEGATMPNGQKYEEWLKSKEGHGRITSAFPKSRRPRTAGRVR